jgi:DNA ligase-1
VHTYDLVVLAAEWGSGAARGWLSNLHLGARDPGVPVGEPGAFVMVGKTFKGLTDELLRWQTETARAGDASQPGMPCTSPPRSSSRSPSTGCSARRAIRGAGAAVRAGQGYREDKLPQDADTIDTLRQLLR